MPALPPERPGCPKAPGGRRPLPDPAAIQLFLVPESAPPYDEEIPAGETGGGRLPAWSPRGAELQGRGGGKPAGRPARDETGGASRPLAAVPGTPAAARWTPAAAPGTPAAAPGLPPGWENRFAQVLAETLAGTRPPGQITPWTTEMARAHIQRLGPQLASGQQPRVRRVVTFHPTADVIEMTVVVGFGTRVRALAVRLERADPLPSAYRRRPQAPRWLCTAVEAA